MAIKNNFSEMKHIDGTTMEISAIYSEIVNKITGNGMDDDVISLLTLLAETQAPLPVPAISEFLNIDTVRIQTAIESSEDLLFEEPIEQGKNKIMLSNENLREWIEANYKTECRKMKKKLSDMCFNWKELKYEYSREHALEYAAAYLFKAEDSEKIWELLQDDEYRKLQIKKTGTYNASLFALEQGLKLYVKREGREDTDDPRLCWIALKKGELVEKAKKDISIAFQWMRERPFEDESRIEDALNRLEVLESQDFFKAAILLIWIEADRQKNLQEEEKRSDYVQKIIDRINEIPKGSEPVDWGSFFSIEFVCWLVEYINSVWPIAKLNKFELIILRAGKYTLNNLYDFQDELAPTLFTAVFNPLAEKNKRSLYESKTKAKAAILLADNGEIEKAKDELTTSIEIVVPIVSKFYMQKVFLIISQAFARIGDLEFSINLGNKIPYFHNAWLFVAISKEFAIVGDFENAIEIVDIIDNSYKSEAFKNISNAHALLGNFESASEIASRIETEEFKSRAYAFIAKEYSKLGDIKKAKGILKSAINIAEEIDEKRNSEQISNALLSISQIAVSIGENELANELLESSFKVTKRNINRTGILYSDDFFSEIAEMFAKAGYIQSAINTAEEIETLEEDKIVTYSKIIIALVKRGDTKKAKEVFESVIIANGNTVEDYDKSKAFAEIAKLLANKGDIEKAKETVKHALKIVNRIEEDYSIDYNHKSNVVSQIAAVAASIGSFDFALKIADSFENSSFKSNIFSEISSAFVNTGDFESALNAVNYMEDDVYKERALSELNKARQNIKNNDSTKNTARNNNSNDKENNLLMVPGSHTNIRDLESELKETEVINYHPNKISAISKIAASIVSSEEFKYFRKFLLDSNNSIFTANSLEEILSSWRNSLLKDCKIPMKYLRECFLYEPSSSINIYNNVIAMIKANLITNKIIACHSIICQCPELSLGFILPDKIE